MNRLIKILIFGFFLTVQVSAQYNINNNLTVSGRGTFAKAVICDTLLLKKVPFGDVRAWGAAGDGVTNDYVAIQKAIDSSRIVNFPPGDYVCNGDLKWKPSVVLKGFGTSYNSGVVARILYKGKNYALSVDTTQSSIADIGIEDLVIIGTDSAQGGIRWGADKTGFGVSRAHMRNILVAGFAKSNSIGVELEGVTSSQFDNVFLDMINGICLRINSVNDVQPGPMLFSNCTFGSGSSPTCSTAVELTDDSGAGLGSKHSITFTGCLFAGDLYGVNILSRNDHARKIYFIGNSFEGGNSTNASRALRIEGLRGGLIWGNGFYGAVHDSVYAIDFVCNHAGNDRTIDGIIIGGNQPDQYNGTGAGFIKIDSSKGTFTDVNCLSNSFVAVTTKIKDPGHRLVEFEPSFNFKNSPSVTWTFTSPDTVSATATAASSPTAESLLNGSTYHTGTYYKNLDSTGWLGDLPNAQVEAIDSSWFSATALLALRNNSVDSFKVLNGSLSWADFFQGVKDTIQQFHSITWTGLTQAVRDSITKDTLLHRSWSLENPAVGDSLGACILSVSYPVTVVRIRAVVLGSSSPSVSFNVPHGVNRDMSSGGVNLFSSAQTITSTTTGSTLATFNDASLAANEWIFPIITAQSGTVKCIDITMEYKIEN